MFSRKKIRHAQENAAFFIKYFFSLSPFSFIDIKNTFFPSPFSFVDINNDVFIFVIHENENGNHLISLYHRLSPPSTKKLKSFMIHGAYITKE